MSNAGVLSACRISSVYLRLTEFKVMKSQSVSAKKNLGSTKIFLQPFMVSSWTSFEVGPLYKVTLVDQRVDLKIVEKNIFRAVSTY